AIIKRVGRIYLYYALSSVATVLLVATAIKHGILNEFLGISTDHLFAEIVPSLLLISPPHLSAILVLYIILTVAVVPLMALARGRYQSFALATSAMVWALSQMFSNYTASLTHSLFLFFNPFAWQFMFAIGLTLGIDRESKQLVLQSLLRARWLRLLRGRWCLALCS